MSHTKTTWPKLTLYSRCWVSLCSATAMAKLMLSIMAIYWGNTNKSNTDKNSGIDKTSQLQFDSNHLANHKFTCSLACMCKQTTDCYLQYRQLLQFSISWLNEVAKQYFQADRFRFMANWQKLAVMLWRTDRLFVLHKSFRIVWNNPLVQEKNSQAIYCSKLDSEGDNRTKDSILTLCCMNLIWWWVNRKTRSHKVPLGYSTSAVQQFLHLWRRTDSLA